MPLQEYAEVDRIANRLLAELDPKDDEALFLAIEQVGRLARAMRLHATSLDHRIAQLERESAANPKA